MQYVVFKDLEHFSTDKFDSFESNKSLLTLYLASDLIKTYLSKRVIVSKMYYN